MTPQNVPHPTENPGTKIIPRLIQEEMKQSYLDYSMSVIVGRALPDVRDGLKPVHRRVLFTMWESGLLHNKPFRKSANVVGNCMAKWHPHGDAAIYDTLVRLAQDFSMRYPLVQGQGNFGSIDGDAPAAMRYTESRLAKLAEEILQDIDKETVKFIPNFDNTAKEPAVMPSKLPNLLVNGSAGIAVGMATNIPPHNLGEISDGLIKLIDHPNASIQELMHSIKGPDFPTGGIIQGIAGIQHAYATGRGKLTLRARSAVESIKDRKNIIVSEIPYMVNKSELIKEIADLVNDKRIQGISDLRDESDREGLRIVIELRKDADSDIVLNQLFSHTRLQTTFSVIMLSLVNNIPRILNLKQMMQHFVEHRKEIVTKRTQFDLAKAKERAHILEGLLVALKNIDAVVTLLKKSASPDKARQGLQALYAMSEAQANAVLDMRLQRLTSLEQNKIVQEHLEMQKLIKELQGILADQQKILNLIKKELLELKQHYGDSRKTQITEMEVEKLEMEDLIEEGQMVITVTNSGYIKRLPLETYKQQHRGGKGIIATTTKEEDIVADIFVAHTHSSILCFTNKGNVHWLKAYQIPEGSRQAKGKAIVNLLELENGENVTTYIPIKQFDEQHYLIMATRRGTVKKTNLIAYSHPRKGGIRAITLDDNDKLMDVKLTDGKQEIILATAEGQAVRFEEADVRATGRSSQGVRGISLKGKDEVVGMVVAQTNKTLLTITKNGYGKRTPIEDYRLISRGGSGVINIQTDKKGPVAAIACVSDSDEIMSITKFGITIRVPASDISIIGRNTQGVRIMRLEQGDEVVSLARIETESLTQ
jgi:DNA gyrase subunit A